MKNVIEILNKVRNTSSTKEKESILRENKSNALLLEVLEYTYNPFKRYKITEKIVEEFPAYVRNPNKFSNVFEMLDTLAISNINNNLRIEVNTFLYKFKDDERELYIGMLIKDLRLGCNVSTINKVWKDLIPKFSVMLAEKYYDNMNKVEGKEFTITVKEDGNRIAIVKENGAVRCFTRQGQEYDGLDDIVKAIEKTTANDFVIDGELMILNHKEIPSDQRYKLTSKIVRKDGTKTGVKVIAFDLLTLKEFKQGKVDVKYRMRRKALESMLNDINSPYLEPVEILYQGNDISMIDKLLEEVTNKGEEGLMINLDEAPYECKRTKNLLKVKKFQTADLLITKIFEGDGNFKNMLGAIEVEFEHKGELHRCNCGTGFSQEERIKYFNNPDLLIGKISEIKYFEISSNDNGGHGLRFPVFTGRIRNDKTEISMY